MPTLNQSSPDLKTPYRFTQIRKCSSGRLDGWQTRFLTDMRAKLDRYGTGTRLRHKQRAKLNEVLSPYLHSADVVELEKRRRAASVHGRFAPGVVPATQREFYPRRRRPWLAQWIRQYFPAIVLGLLALAAFIFNFGPPVVGCNIKGNISVNTGERIYHVPGQKYYAVTWINPFRGERWFCSEKAAQQAGWKRTRI